MNIERRRARYIREVTQQDFTAKDFRTWAGTVLGALALAELKKYDSQAEGKRNELAGDEILVLAFLHNRLDATKTAA